MQQRGVTAAVLEREVRFTRSAWSVGMRPDQRLGSQLREVTFEFPLLTRDVVYVRCGGTTVSACVSCKLVEPAPFRPKHGFLDFIVQQNTTDRECVTTRASGTTTRVSTLLSSGGSSVDVRQLTQQLEKLIKAGGVLDTESLCALPGRRVWSVRVVITVMNDDGNVSDVVSWAAIAALRHFRRPELTIRGDDVIVHPPHERNPVPLSIHHSPMPFTFAISAIASGSGTMNATTAADAPRVVGGRRSPLEFVADPVSTELLAAATCITVAINGEGQVCEVLKGEGSTVHPPIILKCIEAASQLAPKLLHNLEEAMTAHEAMRADAIRSQFLWASERSGLKPIPRSTDDETKESAAASEHAGVSNDGEERAKRKRETSAAE